MVTPLVDEMPQVRAGFSSGPCGRRTLVCSRVAHHRWSDAYRLRRLCNNSNRGPGRVSAGRGILPSRQCRFTRLQHLPCLQHFPEGFGWDSQSSTCNVILVVTIASSHIQRDGPFSQKSLLILVSAIHLSNFYQVGPKKPSEINPFRGGEKKHQ